MAKCYLCGKDYQNVITISGYNHCETICGQCALEYNIVINPQMAKVIREAEGLPDEPKRLCLNCKYLARKFGDSKRRYCKCHKVSLTQKNMDGAFCDCHEFKQ